MSEPFDSVQGIVRDSADPDAQSVFLIDTITPFTKGIDLTAFQVGTIVRVSRLVAEVLVGQGWAILVK